MNLASLIAWANAHWNLVSALLALLAYLVLNLAVARTPIERRAGSPWLKLLDRLATVTMRGAVNRTSAPLLGRSIADEAQDAASEVLAKSVPGKPRDEGGFALGPVLRFVAAIAVLALPAFALLRCSPAPGADILRYTGTVAAVTAAAGREAALLEARACLDAPTRIAADPCLVAWRGRWAPVGQAWVGAGARAQSLSAIVAHVEAMAARRYAERDAGAPVGDGGAL